MRLLILLPLFVCFDLYSQNVLDVYPKEDFDPRSASVIDSNVVVLNPLPFEMVYIVEFEGEVFIERVVMDRGTDSISVSAYINGEWIVFSKSNPQTFCVEETVRYLKVHSKVECDKIYLLME